MGPGLSEIYGSDPKSVESDWGLGQIQEVVTRHDVHRRPWFKINKSNSLFTSNFLIF